MRRTVTAAALAALVVLNAVLGLLVWRDVGGHRPGPATPAPAESRDPDAGQPAAASGRHLLAVGGGAVVRARRGSCAREGRPELAVSTDRGATFREMALPLLEHEPDVPPTQVPTIRTILHLEVVSATEVELVAGGDGCVPRAYVTEDGGRSWQETSVGDIWFVGASETEVIGPAERVATPGCPVLEISALSDSHVKVVCRDGRVLGTDDAGESWVVLGHLPGLRSARFFGLRSAVAVGGAQDCAAGVFSSSDAGGSWELIGCVDAEEADVVLAGGPSRLYALLGGQVVMLSTDGGTTWSEAVPEESEEPEITEIPD